MTAGVGGREVRMAAALLPPSVRRLGLSRAVHEAIFQHADAADLAAHDIAVAEVARRLEADADAGGRARRDHIRSEEHTSELQSLMRTSYAVFCLKKKPKHTSNR